MPVYHGINPAIFLMQYCLDLLLASILFAMLIP